ncbi:hypothetical protein CFIMG_000183RA [Ceratocystis fimbriata CBS 114723]|uniref:Small ribosomal subunit protein mS38 n=2 Tax=Ceratocystis TaxID=5157 RepID=A0A0F8BQA1_CERFI|nr:hypothetical protein CFO_g2935 [Ceratocystis platani]PHH51442.1 hypothetical protein CFIMG_000183RA [Ceratocystis fimbriata CBS 114723]
MIPSAVRRVALAAGPSPASSKTVGGTIVGSCWTLQQRRMSSSKPSSPDGSKSLSDVHTSASSRSTGGKASAEKRKRRAKDALDRDDSFRHLPCVPSTQHMSQEAIGLSTFFSLHRPISVTHSLPKTVTEEAFAAIFSPKSKAAKVSEVISTLSSTVDKIEGPMAKMEISTSHPHDHMEAAPDGATKIDVKYPDGRESSIYVQLNSMAGNFLPFQPPPIPSPQSAAEVAENATSTGPNNNSAAVTAEVDAALETDGSPQHRVYKAMFTIEETTEPDGQIRVVAHSPEIINDEAAIDGPAVTGMSRRARFEDAMKRRAPMHAISVKRQRKLKMKKKKYKKFMKRTRNLRRKQDRL